MMIIQTMSKWYYLVVTDISNPHCLPNLIFREPKEKVESYLLRRKSFQLAARTFSYSGPVHYLLTIWPRANLSSLEPSPCTSLIWSGSTRGAKLFQCIFPCSNNNGPIQTVGKEQQARGKLKCPTPTLRSNTWV